jgi:hypothetical protein
MKGSEYPIGEIAFTIGRQEDNDPQHDPCAVSNQGYGNITTYREQLQALSQRHDALREHLASRARALVM